jgi:hypothetical protein
MGAARQVARSQKALASDFQEVIVILKDAFFDQHPWITHVK